MIDLSYVWDLTLTVDFGACAKNRMILKCL